MKRTLALCALAFLLAVGTSDAQTITAAPAAMNFQGRLAKPDGTPIADGVHTVTFRIFDAQTAGNVKWAEQIGSLNTKNGVFSAVLGKVFPFNDFVLNGNVWLEIQIENDTPLIPRQQFQSVAYALKANTVPDGAITTAKIADSAVTTAKVADGAITQAKLAPGVGGSGTSGPAGGDLTGTFPNPLIASSTITSGKLASDAASLAKVSGGAISNTGGLLSIFEPLTVAGQIQTTNGGVKFPDGTIQTTAATNAATSPMPTGSVVSYLGTTAPDGWVLMDGKTIGSATSGATERANNDTMALFVSLWNSFSNAQLPIQDSDGTITIRGASASADFLASKRLPLPDARGRVLVGLDNLGGTPAGRLTSASVGGVNATMMGGTGGEETHILTIAEMPSHSHQTTAASGYGAASGELTLPGFNPNGSTGNTGGNQPHSVTQPWLALGYLIKL